MEHQSVQAAMQAKNACTGGFMAMDCAAGSPISEDLLNLSGLLNFDGFNESSSPLSSDLLIPSFNYSSLYPMFGNSASLTSPCGLEQARDSSLEKPILQPEFSQRSAREGELDSVETDVKQTSNVILKSIGNFTFSDRMLKVLSLLKESSGWGILAQVWIPIKQGDNYILSTCEQPFLLDHVLAGYREVSRLFTFSAKETPGMFPGVPGRVFVSGRPEWTSNVLYYNKFEYLRVEYAVSHEVRGSLAVPVFDPHRSKCCAVLELVTMKEKLNFDVELENVCRALQAVDLRTTKARVHRQNLTKEQLSALSDILDVLRAVCHAHMLPLALTWMPMASNSGTIDDDVVGSAAISKTEQCLKKSMLRIQESACYVNDAQMHGFLQACAELGLAEGQGIAGKALLSCHPFFSPDVKGYDIGDYPLAHHARKFGLQAAVAIKLRSTYTGDDHFILEFFLPVNCKGSGEQQLLLNNLSATMQRICKSLRTVLDAEVAKPVVSEVDIENFKVMNSLSSEITGRCSQPTEKNLQISARNVEVAGAPSKDQDMVSDEQVKFGLQKQIDKKRSSSEKHISLNVLQQYFAGSLKDAAKGLGVCPTTLKRICRQHGISRWPSRKIKKVNHSLKKIQSVINSVQGVEGALQYDPKTGCLIAAVSPEKSTTLTPGSTSKSSDAPFSSTPRFRDSQLDEKLEGQRVNVAGRLNFVPVGSDSVAEEEEMDGKIDISVGRERSHSSFSSMTDSSNESTSCYPTVKKSFKNESFRVSCEGPVYSVKATYKSDTVRFKLLPSMGCLHLYEEVRKRFKLFVGKFQLNYMDDDEDWVMLTTDADLRECVEVMESSASQSIKLQVRDVPCSSVPAC